ncbi:MAG: GNAT family N-acetyltransferase [Bacteroidota bacterium]|nr:GNAT family N-acetyltransferase [Bacteroidota bacterium]
MFEQFDTPPEVKKEVLDQYLADGWYRMGPAIFTTDFLFHHGQLFLVTWLRYHLSIWEPSKSFHKLEKLNKGFTIEIVPFSITEAHEALYKKYITTMPPGRVESLQELLFGNTHENIYESLVIHLYDGSNLVGAGVFDIGEKSAAGITTFYDPAYKKYSPGRYLIYQKIAYCRQHGYHYFYPGYFAPGIKAFDYKLGMAKESIEFFDRHTKEWRTISNFRKEDLPLRG